MGFSIYSSTFLPLHLLPRLDLYFPSDRLWYTPVWWLFSQNTARVERGRSGPGPGRCPRQVPSRRPSGCRDRPALLLLAPPPRACRQMTQPRRDVGIPPDYPACPAAKWRPKARARGRGRAGAKFGAGSSRGWTGAEPAAKSLGPLVELSPTGSEPGWGSGGGKRGTRPAGDEAPSGGPWAPGPLRASGDAQRAGWTFLSACVARNCRVPRGQRLRAGRTVGGGRGSGCRRAARPQPRPQGRGGLRGEGGDATTSAVRALQSFPSRGETCVREQRRHGICTQNLVHAGCSHFWVMES